MLGPLALPSLLCPDQDVISGVSFLLPSRRLLPNLRPNSWGKVGLSPSRPECSGVDVHL